MSALVEQLNQIPEGRARWDSIGDGPSLQQNAAVAIHINDGNLSLPGTAQKAHLQDPQCDVHEGRKKR